MIKFDPKKFTAPTAKPLPVVLLLDVSGSMRGAKIQNLNEAVKDMMDTFRDTENNETEIHVAIITFGAEVKLHQALASVSDIAWQDLSASGGTPLGIAVKMAKAMIEDKTVIPSRAYRPTVVLVSDGRPGDSWSQPLADFIEDGRSSKCDRMAMAIGANADEGVLGKFIEGTKNPLFYAENAKQLHEFFSFVTMSVTSRTLSQNPNVLPEASDIEVKPTTIEARTVRSESSSAPKQSSDTEAGETSDETSEGGYW